MIKVIQNSLVGLVCLSLTACSVILAAEKYGVTPQTLKHCKTRSCLLAHNAFSIKHRNNRQGKLISEVFDANLPTGSNSRAVMNGALDIGTFGAWELIGTPLELNQFRKEYRVHVQYAQDGETINQMSFHFLK